MKKSVQIWKFESGSDGSCSRIATRKINVFRRTLRVPLYDGCTTPEIGRRTLALARYNGKTYVVDNEDDGTLRIQLPGKSR